jgi:uncharacterized protein (DUF58 family)
MTTHAAGNGDLMRALSSPLPDAASPAGKRSLLSRRFRASGRVGPIRRYHSHSSGIFYIAFTLLLAVGAVNSQNNLLFLALGLSIGGLLISGVLSGASLMGVRIERRAPSRAVVGQPLRIRYRVTNANRLVSAFGLHIVEVATRRRERSFWLHLGRQPRTFLSHIPPADSVEAEVVLTPRARGRINLYAVQIWSTFPFGLTRKSVTFAAPRTILVLPPQLPLRRGLITRFTSRSHSGIGEENLAGHGEEFFGLREYMVGDSPRRIAWKRTARTGQVVVRQNAMPSPPRLWVVINFPRIRAGAPPLKPVVLEERAIALAASIMRAASDGGMAVGFAVPAAKLLHPPREGRSHLDRLLTDLAMLEPSALAARGSPAPGPVARGGACVVIHVGDVDPSAGPAGAHHIPAARAPEYIAPDDEAAAAILALIDSVGADEPGRPRFRRTRSLLHPVLPRAREGS